MKRQAKWGNRENMSQIKEQEKSPEKELNKDKASTLPDTQFKTTLIQMLRNLGGQWMNLVRT